MKSVDKLRERIRVAQEKLVGGAMVAVYFSFVIIVEVPEAIRDLIRHEMNGRRMNDTR